MLIEPWHWLILGLVLIILELFLTSFVSLSIGVAAIVVAAFSWLLPFSMAKIFSFSNVYKFYYIILL